MDAAAWMKGFRVTHEKARAGQLTPDELQRYHAMREELARSAIVGQGGKVPAGKTARESFSVPQVYQVEINGLYKTVTREVSRSRFTATLSQDYRKGEPISYSMTLSRAQEPLEGQATVVESVRQGGASRTTFELSTLSEADAERLEFALFDALLARIR